MKPDINIRTRNVRKTRGNVILKKRDEDFSKTKNPNFKLIIPIAISDINIP